MLLDLQIDGPTLQDLVRGLAQEKLGQVCVPPVLGKYVDHINVIGVAMVVTPQQADFNLLTSIFTTTKEELDANENVAPPGALTASGSTTVSTTVTVQMTVQDKKLLLNVPPLDPSDSHAALINPFLPQINPLGTFDFTPVFGANGLRLPEPTSLSLASTQNGLVVRFDAAAPPANHLQPGDLWCLFVDAAGMVQIAENFLQQFRVQERLPDEANYRTAWNPHGTVPHIDIEFNGIHSGSVVGSADFGLGIEVDLQVSPQGVYEGNGVLNETVTWEPSHNITGLVTIEEATIIAVMESLLAGILDPRLVGGTALDPRRFVLTHDLTNLIFGSARFAYGSAIGSREGMVIGGGIRGSPVLQMPPLGLTVGPFTDRFITTETCKRGVTLGSGASCSASLTNFGKLCSLEVATPVGSRIALWFSEDQFHGSLYASIHVGLSPSHVDAFFAHGESLKIYVRTARGVRLVNFGQPPQPKRNENHEVLNETIAFIDDCFKITDPTRKVSYPLSFPCPPPEWLDDMRKVAVFKTSLTTIYAVRSTDLVTFNQPLGGGAPAVFVPNGAGQVVVPTILALRPFDEGAVFGKASGGDLGVVTTKSKIFQCVAVVKKQGALTHQIGPVDDKRTIILHHFEGRIEATEVDTDGMCTPRRTETTTGLRAEEGKVKPISEEWKAEGLPIANIHTIPGFEDSGMVVAQLNDGTFRSIVRDENGEVRVTGVTPRWPQVPQVVGPWALGNQVGDRVAVFKITNIPRQDED